MTYQTYLFDMDGTLLDTLGDLTAAVNHHTCVETRPYPGIPELLDALLRQGCKVAIISNKPHGAACELAARFFPGIPTFGESPETPRKPAPDMVRHALAALNADPSSAVYVGDSEVDVQTARNAGLPMIVVAWGFRGRAALAAAGAETIVDTAAEILG